MESVALAGDGTPARGGAEHSSSLVLTAVAGQYGFNTEGKLYVGDADR